MKYYGYYSIHTRGNESELQVLIEARSDMEARKKLLKAADYTDKDAKLWGGWENLWRNVENGEEEVAQIANMNNIQLQDGIGILREHSL